MTWVALDIETKSPTADKDLALDFTQAIITSIAWWSPQVKGQTSDPEAMKLVLQQAKDEGWKLVTHGGKFDVKVIGQFLGIRLSLAWDTMLAESIMPDRPVDLDLETCVAKELGYPSWKSKDLYRKMSTGLANDEDVAALNQQDVEYTYLLFQAQYKKLEALGLVDYFLNNNLGMKSLNFLREVEERGIGFNLPAMQAMWKANLTRRQEILSALYSDYKELVREKEEETFNKKPIKIPGPKATKKALEVYQNRLAIRREAARFSFSSPSQVLWLLRDKLGFPCQDLEGKASTGKDVLEFYRGQHPIIEPLLELRHNEHDASSFFANWDYFCKSDGSIHPTYRMDVARTFRLSCVQPNLQQVKRDTGFRELFIAREGRQLMVVDYSQIEPRLIAEVSEDETLGGIFRYGMDLYEVVARKVMGYTGTSEEFKTKDKAIRAVAKEIALSSFYGIGAEKFAYRIRVKTGVSISVRQARDYINGYFELLSGVLAYKRDIGAQLETEPTKTNQLGRKLYFKPQEFYHLAFNKLIQCTGSDINLYSQVDLDSLFKQFSMQSRCIHLIHDEAIFEYPPEEEEQLRKAVSWIMADRYAGEPWNIRTPIKIEIKTGQTWACK